MYMHPPFFGFPSHLSLLLFSHPVVSDSLRSHGLQYICQASLPFTIIQSLLKLTSIASVMACSHLILWYPLLLLPLIFPSIRDFSKELAVRIRWPKYGVSASVLPVSIRSWFPLRLTVLISLLFKGLSGVFSSTMVQRHQLFGTWPSLWCSSHKCTRPLGRPQLWLYGPLSAE